MRELGIYQFIMDSGILSVALFLFEGYLLQYFCGNFARSRLKNRQWNKAAVTVLYFLLRLLVWGCMPGGLTAGEAVIHFLLIFGVTSIVVLGFYRASRGIALFLIVIYVAVSECSVMCAYTFFYMEMKVSTLWEWCYAQGFFAFEEFMAAIEVTGIAATLLYCVLTSILIYFFLNKVVNSFHEEDYEIHRTELLFLITPGITGLLICLLLRIMLMRTIMLALENTTFELLYDQYPLLVFVVPAIMLLCMLSVRYGVKFYQDLIWLNRERNNKVILEKQVEGMQEHITEIERLYSGIRGLKHDMRNTLSIVLRLSADKEGEEKGELEAYLSELNRSLDQLELRYRTGNAVADTLLNMKYHEIQRTMPQLTLDAEQLIFPAGLVIQSYDYGVILGNALDNAMEACQRLNSGDKLNPQGLGEKLFIRLSSFQRGNQFFIRVVNSFDGRLLWTREQEFPQTSKTDRKLHGMGLYHIRNTAEKYYGAVEWSADGKEFTLTVMMQNERRNENEY